MGKYDQYTFYDEPISYKSLLIHPIKMRKYLKFMSIAPILLLDIYSVPDPKVISMKYLEYLFYIKKDEPQYLLALNEILRMVFQLEKDEKIGFYEPDGVPYFRMREEVFDKNDFDEIRNIILEQNSLEPPDDTIQKKLRDSMEEAKRLRQKISGSKVANIEEQMIALSISSGLRMEDIYDMTIRKFTKSLERIDHLVHYKVYLQASMSGLVKPNKKSAIKHWLSDLRKDKFGGLVEYDEFAESVAGAIGKQ